MFELFFCGLWEPQPTEKSECEKPDPDATKQGEARTVVLCYRGNAQIVKNLNTLKNIRDFLKKHPLKSSLGLLLLVGYYYAVPKKLFDVPYATVVESASGELLGATIAADGQWRFPALDSVPQKFEHCLLTFEDAYFRYHPGFNPVAMGKAFWGNISQGRKRGGSTITQQVVRLARGNQNRSYAEKGIEWIWATRLEFRYSKDEILNLYASHAPFGGNVVGLEMASWRYFGLAPHQLSWAESATLAVLPNAPGLIYPGKNQERLLQKRNRLLKRLWERHIIDTLTYELSVAETLPEKAFSLPQATQHLTQHIRLRQEGERVKTSIQARLQQSVMHLAHQYQRQNRGNEVHNIAVLVIDARTREVLAYVGNANLPDVPQKDVDMIRAQRSTGSVLKPLLYAGMLNEGLILPKTLVADIPTQIAGYRPQNYAMHFDGAVSADRALSRSLNIPAVLMLQDYGVPKFLSLLHQLQFHSIQKSADHYGLSLILGGAESSLWELCSSYCGLTQTIEHFAKNGTYRSKEWNTLHYHADQSLDLGKTSYFPTVLSAGSIYKTMEAMREVNRPAEDEAWQFYDSSIQIAWKTGTSFGNRDAWAIGMDAHYVVGVWVGNATGEGRPELTGVQTAAPVLFDVFRLLPKTKWFTPPVDDLTQIDVCQQSGYLPHEGCPKVKQWIPLKGAESSLCPYHKEVHLDAEGKYRVNSQCYPVSEMQKAYYFVLPPAMEWYFRRKNMGYVSLPPFREGCSDGRNLRMEFIYPKGQNKIQLTRHFDGKLQAVLLKVAHVQRSEKLFWYANDVYLGTTQHFHDMPFQSTPGVYRISVTDESGFEIYKTVELVGN